MKTTFEHKFNIGDTVYSVRYQRIEKHEICGICFDRFSDEEGDGQVRENVSYRNGGCFYVNERDLFATRKEAETHLGIGTRANLEHQITLAENQIRYNQDLLKESREKLANLP